MLYEICSECKRSKEEERGVFCPRDVDAQCLHCGAKLCGAHIVEHLREVHCVSLDLKHCSVERAKDERRK